MPGGDPQQPNYEITLPDGKVDSKLVKGFTIERDVYQPDMCALILVNQNDTVTTNAARLKIGGEIKINVHGSEEPMFQGELIGVEPLYKGNEDARVTLRAVNKLHRLLRKRKSRTWTEKTDADIFADIANDAELSLDYKHDDNHVHYKHVYQHNQTDLEFLRMRAARIGCHVWCVDKKLFIKYPTLDQASSASPLTIDKSSASGAVQVFAPRLSTVNVVNKVTVKGWNPEDKELIIGEAEVTDSPLGADHSVKASEDLGNEETFTVDHPIWSTEEATLLAKARLRELGLTYITGTIELHGYIKEIEIGKTVEIKASGNADDPFTGKYYVMGMVHRYLPSMKEKDGKKDVASMTVKLARDARKKK